MFSRIIKPFFGSVWMGRKTNVYNFSNKKPSNSIKPITSEQNYQTKRATYLNIGLLCLCFAACFAGIPLYRTFCQHMGLTGDNDKKTYEFKGKAMNNVKKYRVKFFAVAEPGVNWEFEPVEREVIVGASETAIVFYRLYNKEDRPIVGFSTYNISPEDCNVYFSKIQCFCFNQQMINPKEQLLLPLFFYLEPEINEDVNVSRITEMSITYNFIRSAKQDLAKFAEEEIKQVQENKRKLNQIRAKKMNMTANQYEEYLEAEHEKRIAQNLRAQEEFEKKDLEDKLIALKKEKDVEAEIVKAELISQQFRKPTNLPKKVDQIG